MDLGDIIVERRFTNDGSSLVVKNADGLIYRSPQALLDGFRGKISFDPMNFAGLPEKQQKEILLGLIDLPIDLDELAQQRKEIYQNRTIVNRDVKQLEGQLAGIPDLPDIPDDEVSAVDVMELLKKATEIVASNKQFRDDLLNEELAKENLQNKEDELKLELTEIQKGIDEKTALISLMELDADKLFDPDLEQFKCQLEDVETTNVKVRKKQERNKIQELLAKAQRESNGMTTDMTEIDNLKSKTIREANMPVPGLGFNENGVTFEDIPLSQISDAQKRKVSMAIGMALNPNFKVIWMKDASLLDKDSMKDVYEMAEEYGFQVWLERVEDPDDIAIHILDGMVVS